MLILDPKFTKHFLILINEMEKYFKFNQAKAKTVSANILENIGKQVDKNIGKQVDKKIGKQVDKNIDKQVDKKIGKQVGKTLFLLALLTTLVQRYKNLLLN